MATNRTADIGRMCRRVKLIVIIDVVSIVKVSIVKVSIVKVFSDRVFFAAFVAVTLSLEKH
ncbi:hypothetical protein CXF80_09140 [Shewanella sp. Actino-trap-3]|jgi:hypothetical protein|nr:hypothetical protein CXF80_09140 [Shewanella sp. Actino-trap-3]